MIEPRSAPQDLKAAGRNNRSDEKYGAEVTINEKTKLPLGWVIAAFVFSMTTLASIMLWATRVQNLAADNAAQMANIQKNVEQIQGEMRDMREAQIRMEAIMGQNPSYFLSRPVPKGAH